VNDCLSGFPERALKGGHCGEEHVFLLLVVLQRCYLPVLQCGAKLCELLLLGCQERVWCECVYYFLQNGEGRDVRVFFVLDS
jgi:hypothetical protein